jgi:hypothetical protein
VNGRLFAVLDEKGRLCHNHAMARMLNVTALIVILTVSGCGGSDPQSAATTPPAAVPSASGLPAGHRAYLDALRVVDPRLVSNESRAVSRAENICDDIRRGEFTEAEIASRAAERLSGGDVSVTPEQAKRVVALARQHLCPG